MPAKPFDARKFDGTALEPSREWVAEEGPLQIRVDGKPFTVTLRTPGDDRRLILGLLFAEGLIEKAGDVSLREEPPENAVVVWSADLKLPASEAKLSNRSLASTSSCGLCGKTQWEAAAPAGKSRAGGAFALDLIPACFREMNAGQELFGRTGGCHAAAVFARDGRLLALGEDVGRHNAVDKAAGALLEQGNLGDGFLLCVSGRVSYEIAAKAARAGLSVLAAVSAPSSLAVEFCREAGIALLGFCRGDRATCYAHAEKLVISSSLELAHGNL